MRPPSFADHRDRASRLQRTRLAPEERLMRRWHEHEAHEFLQLSDGVADSRKKRRDIRDPQDE
jgi:hypothetical protein